MKKMFKKKYKERLTRKKVLEKCKDFRLEYEALFARAEQGQTVYQMQIDSALGECERCLQMLKEYSVVRRRKIRRDSKNELTDSSRETGKREKLSHSNDVVATS